MNIGRNQCTENRRLKRFEATVNFYSTIRFGKKKSKLFIVML